MGQIGQLLMPDLYGSFQQGAQQGREDSRRKTLAEYVQPALGGDQGALAKVYGADPNAGMQVQAQAGKMHDDAQKRLGEFARTVSSLAQSGDMNAASQYYSANIGAVQRDTGMNLGDRLDPGMLPHIKQVADALNPQQEQGFTLGAGQTRYGSDGKVIAAAPTAEPKEPDAIRELRLLQQNPDLLGVKERLAAAGRAPSAGDAPYRAATADELRTYGLPEGATGQVNTRTGKLDVLSKPATLSADKQADVATKRQKAQQAQQDAVATFNDSIKKIDDLLNSQDFGKLGTFTGDLETYIPHTGASDAKAQLDTIGNQSVINTLSSLKSLSATGASGFGALSEKEGEILRNAAANLATAQSNPALRKNLLELREKLARSRDRVKQQQIALPEDSVSRASGQPSTKSQATPTDDPLGIL